MLASAPSIDACIYQLYLPAVPTSCTYQPHPRVPFGARCVWQIVGSASPDAVARGVRGVRCRRCRRASDSAM